MMRLMLLSVAMLLVQSPILDRSVPASGMEGDAAKPLDALHIEQGGAYNALAEISQKAHIPIGVDAIQPEKEPTVILDFAGGTVADLLNMFVSEVPDYQWQQTNGFIHVSRKNAHVSLLDIVMYYPGALKKTRHEIWDDLANRQEVSAWIKSSGCTRSEIFNGKEFQENNDRISIEPGTLSVEQLLDEAAVKSGVNYWAVLQSANTNPCRVAIMLW